MNNSLNNVYNNLSNATKSIINEIFNSEKNSAKVKINEKYSKDIYNPVLNKNKYSKNKINNQKEIYGGGRKRINKTRKIKKYF